MSEPDRGRFLAASTALITSMQTYMTPFALLVIVSVTLVGAEQQSAYVCSVYSENTLVLGSADEPKKISGKLRISGMGSGYQIQSNGTRYIVTAAHVILGEDLNDKTVSGVDPDTKDTITVTIGPKDQAIRSTTTRIRIGYLSVPPRAILLDRNADLAVMSLWPDHQNSIPASVFICDATRYPELGQSLNSWGFPDTPDPQMQRDLIVTAINARRTITVNAEIPNGFSGGPLLSADGKTLFGTVLSGSKRQSYAGANSLTADLLGRFAKESVEINGTYARP